MERTKSPTKVVILANNSAKDIHTFSSAIVERANIANRLGMKSYGGDRDIYQALGYKTNLYYQDYAERYFRQDIAKAIIDRPAKATWQGPIELQESSEGEATELEIAWIELDKRLGLKTKFSIVDRLSGIGGFGILFMGLDDVTSAEDFKKPVSTGKRELLYVKAYGEGSCRVNTLVTDTKNPRYGLPESYEIRISNSAVGTTGSSMASISSSLTIVHYTRIIHITDDVLENEIVGSPRLEVVYNRLMDLEKLIGGDAEMFWRSARPGFQGKVDPEFTMTTEVKEALKEQIDEYEHNLRRMLVNEGVEYKALEQQVADPANHVDIQIQMISAVTGIPKRILTGTERGELSSAQDASEWRSYVQGRRDDHAEPHIVRPTIDFCIKYQILPKPINKEYKVNWSDLYAKSEAERVKIGMDRSTALKNYTSSPMAEAVIPPDAFMEFFLGLEDYQIELLKSMNPSEVLLETAKIMAEASKPALTDPAGSGTPIKPIAKKVKKPIAVKK